MVQRIIPACFILLLCFLAAIRLEAIAQISADSPVRRPAANWLDSLQGLADYVLLHVDRLAPEELIVQKRVRNDFQRKGYANVLRDLVSSDPLEAFLSYLKSTMNIGYSMEHKVFWVVAPIPEKGIPGIPFPDDWNYPADPWKREWWSN